MALLISSVIPYARAVSDRAGSRHLRDRVPLLQRLHRDARDGAGRRRASRPRTPSTTVHNYYPTSKWVLFGHHFAAITGVRPADRPDARGAVRLCARAHLAGRRLLPGRRGPRLRSSCGPRCAAAAGRWPRSCAPEIGPVAWLVGRDRHPLHRRHRHRRPRHHRRQRAGREPVGHVHDRHDDPARRSSWASTCTCGGRAASSKRP